LLQILLQILLLLEQAAYSCTSAETQARHAVCILAETGDGSSPTAYLFMMKHQSDHDGQRYSLSDLL